MSTAPVTTEVTAAISTEIKNYYVTVDSQEGRDVFESEEKAQEFAKSEEGVKAGVNTMYVIPATYYVPNTVAGVNELVPTEAIQVGLVRAALTNKQRNGHKSLITAKDEADNYTLDVTKDGVLLDLRDICNAPPKRVTLTPDEKLVKFLVSTLGLTEEQATQKLSAVKAAAAA